MFGNGMSLALYDKFEDLTVKPENGGLHNILQFNVEWTF
jgi:hypothetical protein